MTVTVKNIIPRRFAAGAQTTQYIAAFDQGVTGRTIIDKFTVTNTSASNESFSCNLVASGGTASDSNLVLDARVVAPNETYTCPELVGQVLEEDGFISTLASAGSALTISASGREITT